MQEILNLLNRSLLSSVRATRFHIFYQFKSSTLVWCELADVLQGEKDPKRGLHWTTESKPCGNNLFCVINHL